MIPNPSPTGPKLRGDAREFTAHERSRVRAAAFHARRVHPGPVGALLQRELSAYAEFGYRFDTDRLVPRLVDEILAAPAALEAC
ncbi:hypothetical protein [Pseudonocardia lacus]|uniref:hypothetical protein n=1 Tax=Pseudonocardia lacus TaxID=2835865 RepID=UPI0020290C74|nr:hypothetical protein [Pseudonocardia lacus]